MRGECQLHLQHEKKRGRTENNKQMICRVVRNTKAVEGGISNREGGNKESFSTEGFYFPLLWRLSCYQPVVCYHLEDVSRKPHDNQQVEIYS